MLKNFKQKIKAIPSAVKSSVAGAGLLGVSGLASADVSGDITTAIDSGKAIVEQAAGGLILIAAAVAGVSLVVALLKR
jgi:hypothetical protein